jgi:hypothetical protein
LGGSWHLVDVGCAVVQPDESEKEHQGIGYIEGMARFVRGFAPFWCGCMRTMRRVRMN